MGSVLPLLVGSRVVGSLCCGPRVGAKEMGFLTEFWPFGKGSEVPSPCHRFWSRGSSLEGTQNLAGDVLSSGASIRPWDNVAVVVNVWPEMGPQPRFGESL